MSPNYLSISAALALPYVGFAQGPLAPPGAPAPVMKTLDQIEPRTPVASLPFSISQPGSYYLAGNLQYTAATGDAITIAANDVTLDLMGFTLSSTNAVTGNAIRINGGLRNVAVRNGVITGNTVVTVTGTAPNQTWNVVAAGFGSGINAVTARQCSFSCLRIFGCRTAGLQGGSHPAVEWVTAAENGFTGINVSTYGRIANCSADTNGGTGITNNSGTIVNCVTSLNGDKGIDGSDLVIANSSAIGNGDDGITAGRGSVMSCFAGTNDGDGISGNSVANSVARGNTATGIECNGGTVANSTATSNGDVGIVASPGSVINSVASDNEITGITALFGVVSHSFTYLNGSHGINVQSGTVAFCKSYQNNQNGGSGVDINSPGGTVRTGNNPAP